VWNQIREALSAIWTDWPGLNVDARLQRIAWLTEASRREQHLAAQLHQVAHAVAYEQFRISLEAMARDDAHHADLLQPYLDTVANLPSPYRPAVAASPNSATSSLWRRLLGILRDKRELYERYGQEAIFLDDADLQSLLQQLRAEEAEHQEQLVGILTQLDAHVHETIT
jgi:rubrerythrin